MRAIIICLLLAGCVTRPVYAPREKCPAMPILPNPATDADKDHWIQQMLDIYPACANKRRSCKRGECAAKGAS